MPITQFPLSTSALAFFQLYQQMAFYGPVGGANPALFTGVILRKDVNTDPDLPASYQQRYCDIYKSGTDQLTIAYSNTAPDTAIYNTTNYSMNAASSCNIWMNVYGIIIGTGDIRNLVGPQGVHIMYPWPEAGENHLHISCPSPNTITIYSPKKKVAGGANYVTVTTLVPATILIN